MKYFILLISLLGCMQTYAQTKGANDAYFVDSIEIEGLKAISFAAESSCDSEIVVLIDDSVLMDSSHLNYTDLILNNGYIYLPPRDAMALIYIPTNTMPNTLEQKDSGLYKIVEVYLKNNDKMFLSEKEDGNIGGNKTYKIQTDQYLFFLVKGSFLDQYFPHYSLKGVRFKNMYFKVLVPI